MEDYKKEFIEFMIDCEVLKFGDFVTKSGRKTPFFVLCACHQRDLRHRFQRSVRTGIQGHSVNCCGNHVHQRDVRRRHPLLLKP